MGDEAIHHTRTYAWEAERRMGELLRRVAESGERRLIGRPKNVDGSRFHKLGVTRDESTLAQFLAGVSRETFDSIVEGETTIAEVSRQIRKEELAERAQVLPQGKYSIIYADPPPMKPSGACVNC